MVQYEMYFTNEYIEEIIHELAGVMKLVVDDKAIDAAMLERDKSSLNNLYILRGNESLICIDCNDKDWIFPLVARCRKKDAEAVKTVMLKWDNLIRKEYGQALTDDIYDVYGKKGTLSDDIERYYGKTI